MSDFNTKMHPIRPDPAGGAYSAPPDPLAGFGGPTSRGRGGEGRGRGEGMEGKESLPKVNFLVTSLGVGRPEANREPAALALAGST